MPMPGAVAARFDGLGHLPRIVTGQQLPHPGLRPCVGAGQDEGCNGRSVMFRRPAEGALLWGLMSPVRLPGGNVSDGVVFGVC